MQIISRDDAIAKGLKTYFTGKTCKHGHVVERNVIGRTCVTCKKLNDRENVIKRSVVTPLHFTQFFTGDVISRKEAISLGLKYYFTRNECIRGHIAFRSVVNSSCVHCSKEYHFETYDDEKSLASTMKANEWAKNNRTKSNNIKKQWAKNNPVKNALSIRKTYDKRNETRRSQRANGDADFIVRESMSGMVKRICKLTGKKKKLKTLEYLEYTIVELKDHLESLFTEGMTWENHGEWHIDHIVPVSWWLENGITDPSQINALINLQPLWAGDNLKKSNKLI